MIRHGQGGSIINTASMSGHIVNFPQGQCACSSAKDGLIHLTKSLAVEGARHNIRVNAISPRHGLHETDVRAGGAARGSPVPCQQVCTDTTGSEIVIDGGFTCT